MVSSTEKTIPASCVLRKVQNELTEELFLKVPSIIYATDENWIPVPEKEIRETFDPAVNPYFLHGVAFRWVVTDQHLRPLGRIAAFVNFEKMYEADLIVGGLGFFECIDNPQIAFMLFDTAIAWLQANYGVTAVDGPINFGENDKYWGLLIKGFVKPTYGMNYNPPYYEHLFDGYGFEVILRQFTNYVKVNSKLQERFTRIADRLATRGAFTFKPFRYRDKDRFLKDFVEVYNTSWSSFKNFQAISLDVLEKSVRDMRAIAVEDFIWFAYAKNIPAGFLFALPDANEILRHTKSSFSLFGKLKFLLYKWIRGFSRVRVVVMGIAPQYQNRGLESGLIRHLYDALKVRRYKHVELSWVGDFNKKMMAIHKAAGAREEKQHVTYRIMVQPLL